MGEFPAARVVHFGEKFWNFALRNNRRSCDESEAPIGEVEFPLASASLGKYLKGMAMNMDDEQAFLRSMTYPELRL